MLSADCYEEPWRLEYLAGGNEGLFIVSRPLPGLLISMSALCHAEIHINSFIVRPQHGIGYCVTSLSGISQRLFRSWSPVPDDMASVFSHLRVLHSTLGCENEDFRGKSLGRGRLRRELKSGKKPQELKSDSIGLPIINALDPPHHWPSPRHTSP